MFFLGKILFFNRKNDCKIDYFLTEIIQKLKRTESEEIGEKIYGKNSKCSLINFKLNVLKTDMYCFLHRRPVEEENNEAASSSSENFASFQYKFSGINILIPIGIPPSTKPKKVELLSRTKYSNLEKMVFIYFNNLRKELMRIKGINCF